MNNQPNHHPKPNLSMLGLLAALALCLSSCQSLLPHKTGGIPSDLVPGTSKRAVKLKMGRPERTDDWVVKDRSVGEVWYYEDYWWAKDPWAQKFASWSVFFDHNEKFVGWKLDSPLPQETDARQVFHHRGSDGGWERLPDPALP